MHEHQHSTNVVLINKGLIIIRTRRGHVFFRVIYGMFNLSKSVTLRQRKSYHINKYELLRFTFSSCKRSMLLIISLSLSLLLFSILLVPLHVNVKLLLLFAHWFLGPSNCSFTEASFRLSLEYQICWFFSYYSFCSLIVLLEWKNDWLVSLSYLGGTWGGTR